MNLPPPVPTLTDYDIPWVQTSTNLQTSNHTESAYEKWAKKESDLQSEKFGRLKEAWLQETMFSSSLSDITCNDSYHAIIGMGEAALPLILADLQEQPRHWFSALRAITGFDPVDPEEAGDLQAMTDAWLEWARDTGIMD